MIINVCLEDFISHQVAGRAGMCEVVDGKADERVVEGEVGVVACLFVLVMELILPVRVHPRHVCNKINKESLFLEECGVALTFFRRYRCSD